MSNRTQAFTNQASNPSEIYIEWKSNDEKFAYYDKVKEKRVFIDLPFRFLTLDVLQTVGGFNSKKESGIYANEVHNVAKENLTVKYKKGAEVIADGK